MPAFSIRVWATLSPPCFSAGPMHAFYGKGYLSSAKARYNGVVAQELHVLDDKAVTDWSNPHMSKGHMHPPRGAASAVQDAELAAALQLLQMMWNRDYQVCSYAQPLSHACPSSHSMVDIAVAVLDKHCSIAVDHSVHHKRSPSAHGIHCRLPLRAPFKLHHACT